MAGLLTLTACGGQGAEDPGAAPPEGGAESPGAAMETTMEATMEATPAPGETTEGTPAADDPAFTATLQDADGGEVGTAEFREMDGSMEIMAQVTGMDPGYYGFHVHAIGECEPDSAAPDDPADTGDFMSAGGHIGADESEHPDHPGDLPSLLVQESGEAYLTFQTDRLTTEHFEDEDGAALMVHSDADNFANIPERYAADGPDEDTLSTGDAGTRMACGVIEPTA